MKHMEKVKPFIRCADYWPGGVPARKRAVYDQFAAEGQIEILHVMENRDTGGVMVEYDAIAPHEWILEEMGKREVTEDVGSMPDA